MAKTKNPDIIAGSVSAANSGIVTQKPATPAQKNVAPLKDTTEQKLKSEHNPAFQEMMAKVAPADDLILKRLIQLDLMGDNKVDLTESMPSFKTLFDAPVHVGEQKLENREQVARAADRLSGISKIARGSAQPSYNYNVDFSGLPLKSFSSPTTSGNWNKVSTQPVKVDKNFSLNGSFEQAFQIVLASEGGFSNHKADRGGATIYGIASRSNPKEYAQIMDQLSRGDKDGAMRTTMMAYKTKYWDAVPGIESMSPSAKLVAFDAAVNHGVGFTRTMVNRTNGDTDAMLAYRAQKYAAIIQNDPSQAAFEKGWGNRLAKLDTLTGVSERNSSLVAVAPTSKANLRNPAPEPA